MFKKNILILLLLASCNISYGFEDNTDKPQDPIVILTQRLHALDDREKECQTKKNEKILSGGNIATTGSAIGLTMFLISSFVPHKEIKDTLRETGLLTCVGSIAIGFFVVTSDWQELDNIKTEKICLARCLSHEIQKLHTCPCASHQSKTY